MAKNIFILILLGALLLFANLQSMYISYAHKELIMKIEKVEEAVFAGDAQRAVEQITAFGIAWEAHADVWMSLMLHDHVDSVNQNYLMARRYILNGNMPQAIVYIEQLKYALTDVRSIDQFNVKNIL